MLLELKQQQSLQLICETLIPAIEPAGSATGSSPAGELDNAFLAHQSGPFEPHRQFIRRLEFASPAEIKSIKRFLKLIETPLLCYLATGFPSPFRKLPLGKRVKVLQKWNSHRNPDIRKFFQSLKRLTMFTCYSKPDSTGKNPTWSSIGFSGENPIQGSGPSEDGKRFSIQREASLECEVLIVGSGAGGSVAASELSEAGLDCLIAEKGNYYPRSELGQGEYWGNRSLFDKYGALATDDLAIVILSGSTVGGGTTVNWMTCLEPAEAVRRQWADEFGFSAAMDGTLQASFDSVSERLSVNDSETVDNRQNAILRLGCERNGLEHQTIKRNAKGCHDCGFCGYGCRTPGKQDTRTTYLASAIANGARLVAGLQVERIHWKNGKVCGASAKVYENGTPVRSIEVSCKAVVSAGGSIQTPALLLRSGLQHPQLGKNLFLHPTTAIASFHDEPVNAWSGQPQTVVCTEFSNWDNQGHGVRLETAPMHPGFGAMALAWDNPTQHKKMISQLKYMANTVVLCRDKVGGQVGIDQQGQPRVSYTLGTQEASFLLRGAAEAAKIHHAAGAHTIVGPHQELLFWTSLKNGFLNKEQTRIESFKDFPGSIIQRGARPNHLGLFSAHQMSTCRMAGNPTLGCLDLDGQWRGIENLFACDGSILPTASGVNPMISIMGLSHFVAQQIKSKMVR